MSVNLSALAAFSIVLCLAGCSETGGQAVAGEESIDEHVKELTDALVGFANSQSASFADQLDNLAGSLGERMDEGKDAFADAASQTLEDMDEEIKKLERRAKSERGNARKSSRKAAQTLLEQRDQLARQLETLRESGDDAWEEIAEGFDKSLADLSKDLAELDQD